MEPIHLNIKYTVQDLQKSYKLHYKFYHPIRSKLIIIFAILLIIIGGILIWINYSRNEKNYGWSWFCIIYGMCFGLYYFWSTKTIGKRMFKRLPDFQIPIQFIIDDTGINAKNNTIHSEAKWEHYKEAIVSDDIILLYTNPFKV